KSAFSSSALTGTGESIGCSSGLVHDRTHLVVVPAVRVVVSDNHSVVCPVLRLLQGIDDSGHERLLVQRIGVASVAVLVARGLQEADGGKIAGLDRVEEVVGIVLVICRVAVDAHRAGRTWPGVLQVLGARVVLKWLVMRNVVRF